jgi:16S rRNA (uracil1498-N3)-methyltransferase
VRQFVLPETWDGAPTLRLEGREARRLTAVLRLAVGDAFPAIGPDGAAYECSIEETGQDGTLISLRALAGRPTEAGRLPDVRSGRRGAEASPADARRPGVSDRRSSDATPESVYPSPRLPRLVLAVGFLKGPKLDEAVRAATEAGVAEIVPLLTARSIPREHTAGRMGRLRRVVAEAIGQSGSGTPTRVSEPADIAELVARFKPEPGKRLGVFFHETPLAQASLHRYCTDVPDEIIACVGPEGGFGDDEIQALAAGGFVPAWLGPTVLRAETAAVFAIAALRIVCLERSSWSTIEFKG